MSPRSAEITGPQRGAPTRRGGSGNRGTLHLRKIANRGVILGPDGTPRTAGDGEAPNFASDPALRESWGLDHVRMIGEPPASLDLSDSLFGQGLAEGWMSAKGGSIGLEVESGGGIRDVRYEIVESPGRKDDPDEPSGYRVDHFYTLRLVEAGERGDAGGPPLIEGGADFVYNIAKGAIKTYGLLAATNDALIFILLKVSGIEADDTLNNYDDIAALLGAANDEATASDYVRKSVTSATVTVDDTNNWVDIDVADQTWTGLGGADNTAIGDATVAYDPDTTTGTDSSLVPVSNHDFTITPDNTDVTLQVASAGLLRAA